MKTVDGKYASAKIFTDNVEDYALAQIRMICDNATAAGSTIRVMPDVHPGKVGPIGLTIKVRLQKPLGCCNRELLCMRSQTMSVTDAVLPSLVGIDIGCGVSVMRLKAKRMEFQKLDIRIWNCSPTTNQGTADYTRPFFCHRRQTFRNWTVPCSGFVSRRFDRTMAGRTGLWM